MAQIKLPAGVQGISGKLGKLFFRTLPDGRVIVSLRKMRERTKPPTKKEIKGRQRFAKVNKEWQSLSDKQREYLDLELKANRGKFNGKTYYTLRGYFIAKRLYELNHAADLMPLVIPQPVVITNKPS